jgi:hypothetical protein
MMDGMIIIGTLVVAVLAAIWWFDHNRMVK